VNDHAVSDSGQIRIKDPGPMEQTMAEMDKVPCGARKCTRQIVINPVGVTPRVTPPTRHRVVPIIIDEVSAQENRYEPT